MGTSPPEHPAGVNPTSFPRAKNTWKTPQAVARTSRRGRELEARSPARRPTPASNSCAQHSCGAAAGAGAPKEEAEPYSHPWPDLTASSPLQLDPGVFCVGSGLQSKGWAWVPCPSPACDKSLETRNLFFRKWGGSQDARQEGECLKASALKSVKL